MARVAEDFEPRSPDGCCHLLVIGDGGDRVELSCKDQRRAADAVEIAEPVVGADLSAEEVEAASLLGSDSPDGPTAQSNTGRQDRLAPFPF